jgi:heme exporter protein C
VTISVEAQPAPDRGVADAPGSTGSRATAVLGVVTLAALALWAFLGLAGTPPDEVQGDTVRLLYVHVPVVTSAYLSSFLGAFASGMWLWKRTHGWDVLAHASIELSALFTLGTLVTGAIWGGAAWGVLWVWDARVTSTALLFLLQLGYLAIRRVPASVEARGRRSAVLGLLLVPNIAVINQAVNWWRSVHQSATLLQLDQSKVPLQGSMKFTFAYSMVVAVLVYSWLLVHRFRMGWLADRVEERQLEEALAERRAEGTD